MADDKIRFDKTINISTVVMVVGALVASAMWVQRVDSKLDEVAQLIVTVGKTSERMDDLEREILINRQETLKNRRIYQGQEK